MIIIGLLMLVGLSIYLLSLSGEPWDGNWGDYDQ
jgi:hypothetical protein